MEAGEESIRVTCVTSQLRVCHRANVLSKYIILMKIFHMKYSNPGTTNMVIR